MTRGLSIKTLVTAMALILGGCAANGEATSYNPCPEGQEWVKVGPRADVPTYVCREKSEN